MMYLLFIWLDNLWNYILMVYWFQKKKLSTSQTLNMSNALMLGSKDLNGTRNSFYNGRIGGGLKIYNKRLTEKEIKKMVSKVNSYILRIQPYNPKNVKVDSII